MRKIFVSPLNYSDYRSYLEAFVQESRSKTRNFTHRNFSKKQGWPVSYLLDVLKRRRNLTLTRAFQFAQIQKLSLLETERLIHMVLREDKSGAHREYYENKIDPNYDGYKTNTVSDLDLIGDIELEAVFCILRWSKRMLSSAEIKRLLYTFDLTEQSIDLIIQKLFEKKVINFNHVTCYPEGGIFIVYMRREFS